MATKQPRPTEVTRRHLQHDRDTLTDAVQKTVIASEGDVARDKAFVALSVPKGGRAVRKLAAPERRYSSASGRPACLTALRQCCSAPSTQTPAG